MRPQSVDNSSYIAKTTASIQRPLNPVSPRPGPQQTQPNVHNTADQEHWITNQLDAEAGFELLPVYEDFLDGSASGQGSLPPAASKPAFVKALCRLPLQERNKTAVAMRDCSTLEDALRCILKARSSGHTEHGVRVGSILGLLKRLAPTSPEAQTFACLCLANFHLELANRTLTSNVAALAYSLPANLPDELGPYLQMLCSNARAGVDRIRRYFPEGLPSDELRVALETIEARVQAYETQGSQRIQATVNTLLGTVPSVKEKTSTRLKRQHVEAIERTIQTNDHDDNRPRPLPLWQPVSAQTPHVEQRINTPQFVVAPQPRPDVVSTAARPVLVTPMPMQGFPAQQAVGRAGAPTWEPAACFGQLLALKNRGQLDIPNNALPAISAFATCTDRQSVLPVMKSVSWFDLTETLALTSKLNPAAAGAFALAITLHAARQSFSIPDQAAQALAEGLRHVKRWPDDVPFNVELAIQAMRLPPVLRDAMQTLLNELMHQPRQ
ncbi:hypothetical protein [Hydrogenophaga intermedia]|uniref:hypothetical protein n=1 Tax=Hydrogenophaga intermedia TaxID=65786 RepID=UPI002043B634|nr:hypothetical protein [Hydrogenophaga intermedia]